MTRKFKNFWYSLTTRQDSNDVLLHIAAQPDSPHMYSSSYPNSAEAIAAAEDWIESAHVTVLDYYRGGHKG